jgi:hypothetical protein
MFDRTNMGNPYRALDTRQRTAKTDRTYEVLSGLAEAVGGVFALQHKEHQKDIERQAKNDLVNNTINPDLQIHERVYAETVAKGQALDTYQDLKNRVNNGEFNNVRPEDFQEYVNNIHAQKAKEYSASRYSEDAVGRWNDFWVNQESTITAGQAGAYRLGLKDTQEHQLSQNLAKKAIAGNYTPQDFVDEVYSPDYDMLSVKDRMDTALTAGTIAAESGNSQLLEIFNREFDFANSPDHYKMYDVAMKKADRVKDQLQNKQNSEIQTQVYTKVDEGRFTATDYNSEIYPGGPKLRDARDESGNLIISPDEATRLIRKSFGVRAVEGEKTKATELLDRGFNMHGVVKNETQQEVFNARVNQILDSDLDPIEAHFRIGQLAAAQTNRFDVLENMGDTFANFDILDGNEVSGTVLETYRQLDAVRQGFNNDDEFYASVGDNASAIFQMIQDESRFAPGKVEDKLKAGFQAVAKFRSLKEKGLVRTITTVPQDALDDIESDVKKYIKEDNKIWRIDTPKDFDRATQDFTLLAKERYRTLRNKHGLSHESAKKQAIIQTRKNTTLFDGSIVFTGGAAIDLGADNDYSVKTIKNDKVISKLIADVYSTGYTTDAPRTPVLDDSLSPAMTDQEFETYKVPDWEKVRLVPSVDNQSVMFLDEFDDQVIPPVPFEHIKHLNKARKQHIHPIPEAIKKAFGFIKNEVMITQEEYDKRQITVEDIEE